MKAVLISITPKWVEKIVSGEKTIEVRKAVPKEVPFKAYIYCTKAKKQWRLSDYEGAYENSKGEIVYAQQHIIGEFICDKVERFVVGSLRSDDIEKLACLSYNEMISYFYKPKELDGKTAKQGFAWHISDLKIYDKPCELSEFKTPPCEKGEKACANCKWLVKVNTPDRYECECYVEYGRQITRPPQSWQYVEDLGEVQ